MLAGRTHYSRERLVSGQSCCQKPTPERGVGAVFQLSKEMSRVVCFIGDHAWLEPWLGPEVEASRAFVPRHFVQIPGFVYRD
jgi:hypothetical protein